MSTEVFINGDLIDISEEEVVAASYGNISFGELSKRKGVKSNTWKAPFSPRNKKILDNCELINSNSSIPYRRVDMEVKISGTQVFYGFGVVEESENEYSIQSYARASDFYTTINNKKLTELDLSDYNHFWSEVNIRNSQTNTQGYIYAFVYNGEMVIDNMVPSELYPHMFFHTLIKQISADAGYTLIGDVLTDSRFLNHIVLCNKFPLTIIYGGFFDVAQTLPDLSQSKLWLDFANIYGLQFDIDQESGIIRCDYIDDIIFNQEEEWTNKVDRTERPGKTYSLGYGQKSYLRFNSDDKCTEDFPKEVLIDDQTLELEVDIYKSSFFLTQTFPGLYKFANSKTFEEKDNQNYRGAWNSSEAYDIALPNQTVWWNGTYYKLKSNNTNQEPPNTTYWEPVEPSTIWTIKSRPMYGLLETDPSSLVQVLFSFGYEQITKIISNKLLDWGTSYTRHFRVFDRIKNRTKKLKILVKLNYSDINQLDFTKAKKIDDELFVLEDITQFKLNRNDSTIVNLIRL